MNIKNDFCPETENDLCPNVCEVNCHEEVKALKKRYEQAKQQAHQNGGPIEEFEQAIDNTCAVINTDLETVYNLLYKKSFYKNYYDLCKEGIKNFSLDREMVDNVLFREFKECIRFAALSLDGLGLSNYGEYSLCLKNQKMSTRASLLEENSYDFYDKYVEHKTRSKKSPIKPGYRAIWPNRYQLAIAKLADQINETTDNKQFAQLLLKDTDQRKTDEFIEVHIYGTITTQEIESVKAPPLDNLDLDEDDEIFYETVAERLGTQWQLINKTSSPKPVCLGK